MLSVLYDIVISPLVYLIELVFSLGYRITDSAGLAIIGVSLAVNLLCLPLYRMADAAQDAERDRQNSMKKWVDHINHHFSGDERVMVLQAYYRLRHYHPAQALMGSLSLLLQIPFFIAAYSYLSNLTLLRGVSFLFLPNLEAPDALLSIGGFALNFMPILMTAFNAVSTAIYTRGHRVWEKVQAYGLAIVFLVLLYDSPSGLVFYWTCNQIFSLGKNVFMKIVPNPRKWALLLAQACVLGAGGWLAMTGRLMRPRRIIVVLVALVVFEVLWARAYKQKAAGVSAQQDTDAATADKKRITAQFVAASVLLTVLLGALIPSALIADSPAEFMTSSESPLRYILHTTSVWAGVFLLWWGTYFALSDVESRRKRALVASVLCGICLIDYFAFGRNLGTITAELKFDGGVKYAVKEQLFNLAALTALSIGIVALWKKRRQLVLPATCILAISLSVMSVVNLQGISAAVAEDRAEREQSSEGLMLADGTPRPIFHLSRTKQNVVVVFLDRAISDFVPYIMAERPELKAQFDGFTYYPNTLSHGWFTNFGAPGLYGGYDYVPSAMNERTDETLPEKHNEAMLLMPTLMSESGFRTTVVDPPYAGNYEWVTDLSLYDNLSDTEALSVKGAYTQYVQQRLGISSASHLDRNLVYYALFKAAPEAVQRRIYDKGRYLIPNRYSYPSATLMNDLSTLEVLPELTDTSSDQGGFVLFCNDTTHDPDFLQLPDYEMSSSVNNAGLEDYSRFTLDGISLANMKDDYQLTHYHVNAAALIRLGKWFDWMREQGVYDNTRIIVVSDHGRNLEARPDWIFDDYLDVMRVNPLLMVKDFNATGFTTSDEFMTNADVPTLAMTGVIDSPVNPFTGNPVDSSAKTEQDQLVTLSMNYHVGSNNGVQFDTSDAPWYSVHDNIFDQDDWTRYDTYEEAAEAIAR